MSNLMVKLFNRPIGACQLSNANRPGRKYDGLVKASKDRTIKQNVQNMQRINYSREQ